MVFEFIAVIVAGFAGAGLAMLVRHMLGGRLPRWATPVLAGICMLGVTINNEYGWYGRTLDNLPAGLSVAETVEDQAFYRPWTYAYPFTSRFLAVDMETLRSHQALPDHRLADIYAFGRWAAPQKMSIAVDCQQGRRIAMDDVSFAADGTLVGAGWNDVGAEDPIVRTVCDGVS